MKIIEPGIFLKNPKIYFLVKYYKRNKFGAQSVCFGRKLFMFSKVLPRMGLQKYKKNMYDFRIGSKIKIRFCYFFKEY